MNRSESIKNGIAFRVRYYLLLPVLLLCMSNAPGQNLYFPPLAGPAWDTVSPASLGWCQPQIDTLISFLDQKHTKAFIVLQDGKIAIEHYFGNFTSDSLWYWASAGKSLASFLTGIAQEEGFLSITDSTSQYLGAGWTSCQPNDEGLITIRNQLCMTSGLDDINSTNDCTDDSCLVCIAAPGTRWAYHNAPYTLLHHAVENASGVTWNNYTLTRILAKTGMSGIWITAGFDEVFVSKARTMARFGLLMLANGIWNGDTILHDSVYFQSMISSSQNINPSYGYLWWLNGKGTFMLPGLQAVFSGNLIPSAPPDLYAALGKNDQKIHVIPSRNLIVVRMGDAADTSLAAPTSFDNDLWMKLNDVFCTGNAVSENTSGPGPVVLPNPVHSYLNLSQFTGRHIHTVTLYDVTGAKIAAFPFSEELNMEGFADGFYMVRLESERPPGAYTFKIIKM